MDSEFEGRELDSFEIHPNLHLMPRRNEEMRLLTKLLEQLDDSSLCM